MALFIRAGSGGNGPITNQFMSDIPNAMCICLDLLCWFPNRQGWLDPSINTHKKNRRTGEGWILAVTVAFQVISRKRWYRLKHYAVWAHNRKVPLLPVHPQMLAGIYISGGILRANREPISFHFYRSRPYMTGREGAILFHLTPSPFQTPSLP